MFFFPAIGSAFSWCYRALCCAAGKKVSKSPASTHSRVGCFFITGIKKGVGNMINAFFRRDCPLLAWTFSANIVLVRVPRKAMGAYIVVPPGFRRRAGGTVVPAWAH